MLYHNNMIWNLSKPDLVKVKHLIKIRNNNDELALSLNEDIFTPSNRRLNGVNYIKENPNKYTEDLYYQKVRVKSFKYKNYFLGYDEYLEGYLYPYGEIKIKKDYVEEPSVLLLNDNYRYLKLDEDETTWMSVVPHEINTMAPHLNNLSGDIVVLGLGLGYFTFHALNNKNVTSVKVIELNQDIITIFNMHLKPFFPHLEKLEIIKKDAINYCKSLRNAKIFADLWHDSFDGLEPYCALRKLEEKNHLKISYWIEESLLAGLRRLLINLIEEELDKEHEYSYEYEECFDDHIINSLHKLLKEKAINSYEELIALLSDKSLRELAALI